VAKYAGARAGAERGARAESGARSGRSLSGNGVESGLNRAPIVRYKRTIELTDFGYSLYSAV